MRRCRTSAWATHGWASHWSAPSLSLPLARCGPPAAADRWCRPCRVGYRRCVGLPLSAAPGRRAGPRRISRHVGRRAACVRDPRAACDTLARAVHRSDRRVWSRRSLAVAGLCSAEVFAAVWALFGCTGDTADRLTYQRFFALLARWRSGVCRFALCAPRRCNTVEACCDRVAAGARTLHCLCAGAAGALREWAPCMSCDVPWVGQAGRLSCEARTPRRRRTRAAHVEHARVYRPPALTRAGWAPGAVQGLPRAEAPASE